MGYTHYWRKVKDSVEEVEESNYQLALKGMREVLSSKKSILADCDGDEPLNLDKKGIYFNGIGDDSYEGFYLAKTIEENDDFEFCKTARQPYDVVVVACLIILNNYCSSVFQIESDGKKDEWKDGQKLVRIVLGLDMPIPEEV